MNVMKTDLFLSSKTQQLHSYNLDVKKLDTLDRTYTVIMRWTQNQVASMCMSAERNWTNFDS